MRGVHADVARALVDVPGGGRIFTHILVQYAAGVLGAWRGRVGTLGAFQSHQSAARRADGKGGSTDGWCHGRGRWTDSQWGGQLIVGGGALYTWPTRRTSGLER